MRSATAAALLVAGGASAQVVFTVNSVLDQPDDNDFDDICHTAANTCTLRAAVMEANTIGGPGVTIVLPANALPYGLTRDPAGANGADTGDLNLTTPSGGNPVIAIIGAGAATTIIDANDIDRVFRVHAGRTAHISGVTVRNGKQIAGGGIRNAGTLTLSNTTVSGNAPINTGAGSGSGIENESGASLTVSHSIVSGNMRPAVGGGIYNAGTLVLSHSTVSGNEAAGQGGGIVNEGLAATAEVIQSTVSANSAFLGGGISNLASLFVTNTTISANGSSGDGGGIRNRGTANVYNSTIVFNEANTDAVDGGAGAGVFNEPGDVFNLRNTVMAGNRLFGGSISGVECSGQVGSFGRNKFTGCTFAQNPSDVTAVDSIAEFGPLQDNGGPTKTHALVAPSNIIDGADPIVGCVDSTGSPLAADQRNFARVAGMRCDLGAFEFGALPLPSLPFADSFE